MKSINYRGVFGCAADPVKNVPLMGMLFQIIKGDWECLRQQPVINVYRQRADNLKKYKGPCLHSI